MPALTTITVNDREDTPVAHTYTPGAPSKGVYEFVNSDGVPIGDEKLTVSISPTGNGNIRTRIRMMDPIVVTETINGVDRPKVERTAYASLEFTFSDRSSKQERENLVGKLANALSESQTFMMSVCTDLEGIY
jgi:hypothetical protein